MDRGTKQQETGTNPEVSGRCCLFLNDSLMKPVLPPPHGDGVPCSTGGLRVSPSAARQGLALRPCGCQVPKSWEETHCPAWVRKWVLGDPAVGTSAPPSHCGRVLVQRLPRESRWSPSFH